MSKDINGKIIRIHNVLRNVDNHAIVLVVSGNNKGYMALAVTNEIAGINDWLDVYPDGTFEILGSADTHDDEMVGAQ